ncbi:MAG: A/G-specific adenine glycosylase [Chloroflexota bacterium]
MTGRAAQQAADAATVLAVAVEDWYRANGRDLAFRRRSDPYAVLVSEAMAQQTQAERAAVYWERFMTRFPTVDALAAATPADVLREWRGLGYDRRALSLWRAARAIRDDHGGLVPASIEELERLPGVGPYTARAVAAIAFGQPVGAVDVNVRRVLVRIVAAGADISDAAIQAGADAGAAAMDPATWTHAVMDLGATVCRPRHPRCEACPARTFCRYPVAEARPSPAKTTKRTPGFAAATALPPVTRFTAATAPRPRTPFPATTRWLRGRILDRLREAAADEWVILDGPIGTHALDRVHAATEALASEGMIEIRRRSGSALHARLALA